MASPNRYFEAFRRIDYGGRHVIDITSRAAVMDSIRADPLVFYPYELREGQRADIVADAYYDDPHLHWLLYLANDVLDPYHDWHMSGRDFETYVASKYGSMRDASRRVAWYRVNWFGDDRVLDEAGFSSLTAPQRKYWSPVYAENGRLVGYERARLDWIVNTNRVVALTLTSVTGTFEPDSYATLSGGGRGRVAHWDATTSVLSIDRVSGDLETVGQTVTDETTGATGTLTDSEVTSQNIPVDEEAYWSPVSSLDVETESNEARRVIQVVDRRFVTKAVSDLKRAVG